jgi:hypothetical protein
VTGPRALPRPPAATEKQLAAKVRDLAALFGWDRYHTHRSDFSPAGFPDETLVRPPRLIFAELKSDSPHAKPSPAQQTWLDVLARIPGVEVYLWRPKDLDLIVRILR